VSKGKGNPKASPAEQAAGTPDAGSAPASGITARAMDGAAPSDALEHDATDPLAGEGDALDPLEALEPLAVAPSMFVAVEPIECGVRTEPGEILRGEFSHDGILRLLSTGAIKLAPIAEPPSGDDTEDAPE
jgi:hypothetical protein